METESILGLISLGVFILFMVLLRSGIGDIIKLLFAVLFLIPFVVITSPLWGLLWLLGNIFNNDGLIKVGESFLSLLHDPSYVDGPPPLK